MQTWPLDCRILIYQYCEIMYVLVSEGLLVFAYLHGHSRALDEGREQVKGLDAMKGKGGKTSASLT